MRPRSCVTGTFLVVAALMGATPAAAAVKATPNPAGNGMTTITGQCGGSPQSAEPATLVVNDNSYIGLGYVFRTDPRSGTMLPRGSTVTLYLI